MLFHGLFPAAWCHFKALTMAPGNIYMRKLVVYTTRTRIDNARTMFCKITNRNINKKNIHELLTHVWWTRDALLAEGSFRCFDLTMLESYRMIKDKYFSVQNPVRKHFRSASQHCWKPSIPNQISPAFGGKFGAHARHKYETDNLKKGQNSRNLSEPCTNLHCIAAVSLSRLKKF